MAAEWNFTIDQGAEFDRTLTWKDDNGALIDLTGFTGDMQARFKVGDAATLFQISTTNAKMILGGAAATIQLKLSAADTRVLSIASGVHDLEMVSSGGKVTRLLQGKVTLDLEVTR